MNSSATLLGTCTACVIEPWAHRFTAVCRIPVEISAVVAHIHHSKTCHGVEMLFWSVRSHRVVTWVIVAFFQLDISHFSQLMSLGFSFLYPQVMWWCVCVCENPTKVWLLIIFSHRLWLFYASRQPFLIKWPTSVYRNSLLIIYNIYLYVFINRK